MNSARRQFVIRGLGFDQSWLLIFRQCLRVCVFTCILPQSVSKAGDIADQDRAQVILKALEDQRNHHRHFSAPYLNYCVVTDVSVSRNVVDIEFVVDEQHEPAQRSWLSSAFSQIQKDDERATFHTSKPMRISQFVREVMEYVDAINSPQFVNILITGCDLRCESANNKPSIGWTYAVHVRDSDAAVVNINSVLLGSNGIIAKIAHRYPEICKLFSIRQEIGRSQIDLRLDSSVRGRKLRSNGYRSFRQGRYAEAEKNFAAATFEIPYDRACAFYRALNHIAMGRRDLAMQGLVMFQERIELAGGIAGGVMLSPSATPSQYVPNMALQRIQGPIRKQLAIVIFDADVEVTRKRRDALLGRREDI